MASPLARETYNNAMMFVLLALVACGLPLLAQGMEEAARLKRLGLDAMSAGNLEQAEPALRKACELAPSDEDVCYYLARNLHVRGNYEAAREPFDIALRAAPKGMLPRVHRAIALNFMALGMAPDAERHFLKAIQLNVRQAAGSEDPRVDYGAFLFRQGRTEEALVPLEQAVREVPTSPKANTEWGRVLLHLGRLEQAVGCLEKAVKLDPKSSNAHLLLGRAYLRLGRTTEGEREMQLGVGKR